MEDPAIPGTVVVVFRSDASAGAHERGLEALLALISLQQGRVESMDASGEGLRVGFVPPTGMDLSQLARESSTAVESALAAKGIDSGWSLWIVDDQGRIYRPR